jgi:hypothetical protein
VHRCLEKGPGDRFTAAKLAVILWALSKGESVRFSIRESYRLPSISPRPRKRLGVQIAWGLGVGLTAALISAGVVGHLRGQPARPVPVGTPAATAESAPAPAAAPAVAPSPATVTISIDSEPTGAEARLAGSAAVLGTTPFVHQFPKADRLAEIELRARGYEVGHLRVSTAVSGAASATLIRSHPGVNRPAAPGRPGSVAREATIDPFQ